MQIDLIKLAGGTKARAKDVNDNNDILKSAIYALEEQMNTFSTFLEDLKRKPTRAAFEVYYYYSNSAPTGAFALWTGEWINHCKSLYPDFFNELVKRQESGQVRVIENDEYEEEVEEKGQCGAFVVDTLNGHVRLPKITRFISSLENEIDIGTTQDAALQKHKHNFIASTAGGVHGATATSFVASTTYAASSARSLWTTPGNVTNTVAISENGNDEKGYPQNVRLGLYIQVANNVAEICAMDPKVIEKELADAVESIEESKTDALTQIETEKNEALSLISEQSQEALGSIASDAQNTLTQIDTASQEALGSIASDTQDALTQIDTALQDALEELNATDVLSGIEQALHQINSGY